MGSTFSDYECPIKKRNEYEVGVAVRFSVIIFTIISNTIACIWAYYKLKGCECFTQLLDRLNLSDLATTSASADNINASNNNNPYSPNSPNSPKDPETPQGVVDSPKAENSSSSGKRTPAGYSNTRGASGFPRTTSTRNRNQSTRNIKKTTTVDPKIVFGTFVYIFLATIVTFYNMIYRFILAGTYSKTKSNCDSKYYIKYNFNESDICYNCNEIGHACYTSDVIDEYLIIFARMFLLIFFSYRVEKVFKDSVYEFSPLFINSYRGAIIIENILINTLWIVGPSFGIEHNIQARDYNNVGIYCWNSGNKPLVFTHFILDSIFNIILVSMFSSRLTQITSTLQDVSERSRDNSKNGSKNGSKSNLKSSSSKQNNYELVLVALRQLVFVFISVVSSWVFYLASVSDLDWLQQLRWLYPLDWSINVWCVVLMFKFDRFGRIQQCITSEKVCEKCCLVPNTWKVALRQYARRSTEIKRNKSIQRGSAQPSPPHSSQGSPNETPNQTPNGSPDMTPKVGTPNTPGTPGTLDGRFKLDRQQIKTNSIDANVTVNLSIPNINSSDGNIVLSKNTNKNNIGHGGINMPSGSPAMMSVKSNSPISGIDDGNSGQSGQSGDNEKRLSGPHSPVLPSSPKTDDDITDVEEDIGNNVDDNNVNDEQSDQNDEKKNNDVQKEVQL